MDPSGDPRNDVRTNLKAVFWFLLFNFILSVGLGYAYIEFMPGIEGPLSSLFVHGALVSNTAMVYVALFILFAATSPGLRKTSLLMGLMVAVVTFLHMLNVLDIIIFRIFRYHINSMVLTLVFTEGAVASIELPASMEMTIAEAPEGVKGDSANNVYKAAVTSTGLTVQVPLFINPGDRIMTALDPFEKPFLMALLVLSIVCAVPLGVAGLVLVERWRRDQRLRDRAEAPVTRASAPTEQQNAGVPEA